MDNLRSTEWWKAAGTRAIKTAAQAVLGGLTVGAGIGDVDWPVIAGVAAMAAFYSLVTSLAGLPEVGGDEAAD